MNKVSKLPPLVIIQHEVSKKEMKRRKEGKDELDNQKDYGLANDFLKVINVVN